MGINKTSKVILVQNLNKDKTYNRFEGFAKPSYTTSMPSQWQAPKNKKTIKHYSNEITSTTTTATFLDKWQSTRELLSHLRSPVSLFSINTVPSE